MAGKKITLGTKVRDKVTGLEGIAICRSEYLNGCIQYAVKPPVDKDGKMREAEWIDEGQIEIVESDKLAGPKKRTGGGFRETPRV